jgi:predicted dehydrogenase
LRTGSRDRQLSVAVVGVGEMGINHARCLATMKGVDLIAVVDSDENRRNKAATAFDCLPLTEISELPHVDAAIVAVPSAHHAEVGSHLMQRGIHCLVEKPLALDREEALALIAAAKAANVVLQVGHIERFNPAVRQLATLLEGQQALVANTRRMSAVSARVSDIDVVMDLMVHDLDVVLYLMGNQVDRLVARGINGPNGTDYATALLSLDNNRMASLTASRITQNQIRKLEITTNEQFYSVDYSNQELLIYRQGRLDNDEMSEGRYVLDVETRRVFVRRTEPLVAELEHFVGAVRGENPNEVDGETALSALNLVWEIQEQLRGSTSES